MIQQIVFLLILQWTGSLFALAFRRRLPLGFILISGLLWGSLFWVLGSIILLVLRLPYTLLSIGMLYGGLFAALLGWNLTHKNLSFNRAEAIRLALWLLGSVIVFSLVSWFNLTTLTPDSLVIILNGRAFATQGFSPFVRSQLALRGVFVQVLQAPSLFFGIDYLYALQPALTLTGTALFIDFSRRILHRTLRGFNSRRAWAWLSAALLLGMSTTYFLAFQTFYIHTNLLPGIFLLAGLSCFWLALEENNNAWLVFAMLAWLAFSLLRTEAPLFALLFLALFFSHPQIPYRVRVAACLPYTLLITAWYAYLLASAGSGTYILSPRNILPLIAALLGFMLLIAASRWKWVQDQILTRLPWLLMLGLFAGVAVLAMLDPARMAEFLRALILDASVFGLWGVSWFLVAAGLLLAAALPAIPYERLFAVGIPAFLVLLYAVATLNVASQLDWGDSANRMLTHIFPAAFLYLTIKFGRALESKKEEAQSLWATRPPILAALGASLIIFVLVLLLAR